MDFFDVFGNDISPILNKRLFLFDMDGTIYKEDKLFDGVVELLNYIKYIGGKYVFITNNSSKSVTDYISKLNSFKINTTEEDFFTSSQATIVYLKENYPQKKIYCQGTKSLLNELKSANINVTCDIEDDIDVILVGFDTELTSEKLRKTCELLNRDVPFIATNPDLRCPVSFGYIPDCGSICNMLTAATYKKPIYIGKPEPTMINLVRDKYHFTKDETVVIGDRLYTDIASGLNASVSSLCVLTGEATIEDITEGEIKPTYTLNSITDILNLFRSGEN